MSLLTYYTDNWSEVRTQLETRMSSHEIDDEAKATFREALDAHEAGFYRSVSRVLFPEFERMFVWRCSTGTPVQSLTQRS